nr:metallophosphoesterase family protein [Sporosarcina cyprini]
MTDIHGNSSALHAVLVELDNRLDIDHIYCLGDMIGIGPDSNEVLYTLFERDDISMVTGNHDEAVLALLTDNEYPLSHLHAREHHQWMDGHSLLFTHYHIDPNKLTAPISQDPFSRIVEPSLSHVAALFRDNKEALICFGHHHPVHFFSNETTIYLNPGSLGCNSRPTAPYAIVEMTPLRIEVHLEEAVYDNTTFLASYEELQVPQREFLLRAFHGNQLNL